MSSPEELYLKNLDRIERIAGSVARRHHLNAHEAEEFVQEVQVRLLDADYAVIRKFEGRSTFTTYLTTVIKRLFYQYRVELWGKWRPSAEAKRIGEKAITLERLVTRDGYTFDEAVKELTTPGGSPYTTAELEAIYLRLPNRGPRPIVVSGEVSADAAAVDAEADDRVERADRERSARKASSTIDGLLASMDAEDRLILQMRYWDGLKVPDIARRLRLEQKKLYKRLDRLFGGMRSALERAGVGKAEVGTLLSRGDQEIKLNLLGNSKEIPPFRPSKGSGGKKGRRGGGGLR
jgi:RNA polymerase sigma factor for flagellar operon FliA